MFAQTFDDEFRIGGAIFQQKHTQGYWHIVS